MPLITGQSATVVVYMFQKASISSRLKLMAKINPDIRQEQVDRKK